MNTKLLDLLLDIVLEEEERIHPHDPAAESL
jgi:hypothetical protein